MTHTTHSGKQAHTKTHTTTQISTYANTLHYTTYKHTHISHVHVPYHTYTLHTRVEICTQRQYSEDNVAHTKENKETIVIDHLQIEVKGRAGDSERFTRLQMEGKRKHTYNRMVILVICTTAKNSIYNKAVCTIEQLIVTLLINFFP